ncbi:MAG: haloalkane dehalogenase [Deltaproteobacteria bacterium]|nr:haloalkane dehalogenase [Deltaproteobacteria bacterium]
MASSQDIQKKRISVLDSEMAYREVGHGQPIVFLHGNPTSSFLWRNILPLVARQGRCIAPDLMGFGDSPKLSPSDGSRYHFAEQRRHLDAFFEAMELGDEITLVLHDWGSVFGFDWANRHRERVRAIAYMEAVVRNVGRADLPNGIAELFESLRTESGANIILQQNMYIEQALPASILRSLTPEEHEEYRRPFAEAGESRRPILSLCRDVPFDDTPADVFEAQSSYAEWLSVCDLPKLFINAEPGAFLVGELREFCRSWPNQTEVTVKGSHFLQEDSPMEIGEAIASWLAGIQKAPRRVLFGALSFRSLLTGNYC